MCLLSVQIVGRRKGMKRKLGERQRRRRRMEKERFYWALGEFSW